MDPMTALAEAPDAATVVRDAVARHGGDVHDLVQTPRGAYRVLFSDNVTDRIAGSAGLKSRMCRNLWIEPGKVSEDGVVSVDLTSCTGMCDQGPAMLVNNRAITRLG